MSKKTVGHIPNIEFLIKSYSNAADGNDQKAAENFKMFETTEKLTRLKNELSWIRDGLVKDESLERVLGNKRKAKYETYDNWAKFVMIWLAQAKKN